jgi:sucrose-6-phosphate hydrolase SacC (GH32 family)
VLELFVNDGRTAVTRVIYPRRHDQVIELVAEQGTAQVISMDLWEMKSIW